MEFLNSTISINPRFSPAVPFLTWKSRRNPLTLTIPNSKRLSLQPSFSLYLSRSIPSRKLQISAHFRRTSSRPNYLRKKLTQQQHRQQQVSENLVQEFDAHDSNCDNLEKRRHVSDESFDINNEDSKTFDINNEDSKNVDDNFSHNEGVEQSEKELRKKKIGESVMWNKLESWVEQYKKDSEFWGIGTGPIFTVFQDAEGKVERVVVNEDEIVRRSRVDHQLDDETEDLSEVNFKVSFAKDMAREMEKGSNVIPKHSSVAKFLQSGAGESRVREAIPSLPRLKPVSFPSMSRVGVIVLCGLSVIWAITRLLTVGNDSREYTLLEKEMLRRKLKTRKEEEKTMKGSVEVLQDQAEPKGVFFKRPQLDKEVLVNSIINAKGSNNQPGIVEHGTPENELQGKIEEIRAMARHARETERRDSLQKFSGHNATPGSEHFSQEVHDKDFDEIDIRTSQNCNTSSIRSDIQNSKSTEVDTGDPLQTEKGPTQLKNHKSEDTTMNETPIDLQEPAFAAINEVKDRTAELAPSVNKENWIEKNFHEFEPIVEKVGVGFRDSYHLAREKASQELGSEVDLAQLKSDDAENELEWMNNEKLREIVFKVRDNELSGRDPFHLMDEEDKHTFFSGLEKKVEQENRKLLKLHEYFHSNIENLDYGADGISLYDPPEKIIPRWKVPPAERNPEFLNKFVEQRKDLIAESLKNSFLSRKTAKEAVDKSEKLSSYENGTTAADKSDLSKKNHKDNIVSSKTIIESSDGSVRAGKRAGKEFWQHTKKWSEGFLESYNAESDPEIKATMRDMGKDLDRWITEKEVKEAAELMERLPEKGFIKQKLNKVKREMELYGPQAVVSKYREYAEEKEEDYLWWLDLPHVLCIELYTVEDGEQRVGFYSLEMAADLELDPKQYHVIAFEDAGDCKNLCYIIQATMEVVGNGNAFVVARPPKDAFREAKSNGFSVTVIRKGQLQLNIDQTLEEVEESIAEIGSKIYHDKITKERSVDVNGLMKGVFGVSKPSKRKRSKRKPKRRIKP